MVKGLEKFKEHFAGFEDNYVIKLCDYWWNSLRHCFERYGHATTRDR